MSLIRQRLSLDLASQVWAEALSGALKTRSFTSLTTYADSRPEASLAELAADLGGSGTAPTALEQRLVAEAEATGMMERCARSLFARDLRGELPQGWPPGGVGSGDEIGGLAMRLSEVFLTLAMALPEAYQDAIQRVQQAMNTAEFPAGWLPEGPDDPALMELFACYWRAPSM
jgi:hypothetical protein